VSFIAWIVLALVAGFIASQIVNRRGEGFFLDVVLGTVASVRRASLTSTRGAYWLQCAA
jgi:uncharacterized membrane protein YeaQ/YmgE (transglycosylase-associated protein family)